MRLYHYTAARNVEPIRELGIVAHPRAFAALGIDGVPAVWLTADDRWSETTHDARIVVDLSVAETHVWRWLDLGPKLCAMAGGTLPDLTRFDRQPGTEDWWVYLRNVPRERIERVDLR